MPTPNFLTYAQSTSGGSLTTTSFTPAAGALLVVFACVERTSVGNDNIGDDIVVSGGGLTWDIRADSGVLDSVPSGGWLRGAAIFTAVSSGALMTVTAGLPSGTNLCTIGVAEVAGYNASTPIGLAAGTGEYPGDVNNAYSVSLGGTTQTDSLVLGCVSTGHYSNPPTITAGSGWTRLGSYTFQNTITAQMQHLTGAVSSSNWSAVRSIGVLGGRQALAIEILAESDVGGGFQPAWARNANVVMQ